MTNKNTYATNKDMNKEYILNQFEQMKKLQAAEDNIFNEIVSQLNLEDETMTKDYLFDYLYNEETPYHLLLFLRRNKFIED